GLVGARTRPTQNPPQPSCGYRRCAHKPAPPTAGRHPGGANIPLHWPNPMLESPPPNAVDAAPGAPKHASAAWNQPQTSKNQANCPNKPAASPYRSQPVFVQNPKMSPGTAALQCSAR